MDRHVAALLIALAVGWSLAVLSGWLGYRLMIDRGRLLLRLEDLEERLDDPPPAATAEAGDALGLPVGAPAPDFELPSLTGGRRALSDWRGRRALLIFFNPRCGFCRQMLPDMRHLGGETGGDRPMPIVITTGDIEENRGLMSDHGIELTVLVQEAGEVAAIFRAHATPTAHIVDERGLVASPLAIGAVGVMALARVPAAGGDAPSEPPRVAAAAGSVTNRFRPVAESRLNRSGLKAGTPAPPFSLPTVTGGNISLEAYRGRPVLLVFSDPSCGPCDALAPRLEQLHRGASDLAVLMVSRGSVADNRAKVAEYDLTLPIGLQRHWEVSRAYGMFATPIGYLIDAQGILASDVAVGVEPILALAACRERRGKEVLAHA